MTKSEKIGIFQIVRNKLFWHLYLTIQLGDHKNEKLELSIFSLSFYVANMTSHHYLKLIGFGWERGLFSNAN